MRSVGVASMLRRPLRPRAPVRRATSVVVTGDWGSGTGTGLFRFPASTFRLPKMHSPSTRFQLLLRLLVDVHWLSDPGSGSQGLNLRYARGARKSTWRERQQWWR